MLKPISDQKPKGPAFDEPANARFIMTSGALLLMILAARLLTLIA